jgi:hypothetical protein
MRRCQSAHFSVETGGRIRSSNSNAAAEIDGKALTG